MKLQGSEGVRKLSEGSAVAKRTGLALDDSQIVPPVIDGLPRSFMRPAEDALMLAYDLAFCRDDQPIRIDPEADRSIGEGGRDAIAVPLQMDETGRRYPFGVFDKSIERPRDWHESLSLFCPDIGNGAAHLAMRCHCPECLATLFQPVIQGIQRGKARDGLPEPVASILDVLLDLPLLPARRGIAELGLEQVVTGHRLEADVDITLLAATDLVYSGPHIVIDAAPWNATEHTEGMGVGVEQHLVGLQEIRADDEGSGIAELGVGDL